MIHSHHILTNQVKLTSTPCRSHWTARWTRSDLQRAQNQSDVDDDDDNVYDDYDDDDGDDDDDDDDDDDVGGNKKM